MTAQTQAPVNYRPTVRACYVGYVTQAIVNNLAPLLFVIFSQNFDLSLSELGGLIVLNFGTQLVLDVIATRYADRIGYRVCLVAAHLFAALGLLCLGILPRVMTPMLGLALSVILYGVGGGLIEVLISPVVDSVPGEKKASEMVLLHAAYCWGQVLVVLVSTLALTVLGRSLWYILPCIWALVPLCNAFAFLRLPIPTPAADHATMSLRQLMRSHTLWIFAAVIFCSGAAELAMSQWSSLFAELGLGVNKTLGDLLGPCLFGILMGLGRTLSGVFGGKMDLRRGLALSAAFCTVCYLVAGLSTNAFVALMGCAFCGLGVAILWPGVYSLASARYPAGGTAMFGLLAISGDLGCSFGPWLSGKRADAAAALPAVAEYGARLGLSTEQMALKLGLLCALIFPIAIVVLCGVVLRKREGKA